MHWCLLGGSKCPGSHNYSQSFVWFWLVKCGSVNTCHMVQSEYLALDTVLSDCVFSGSNTNNYCKKI